MRSVAAWDDALDAAFPRLLLVPPEPSGAPPGVALPFASGKAKESGRFCVQRSIVRAPSEASVVTEDRSTL
jgi:hypothetical protein